MMGVQSYDYALAISRLLDALHRGADVSDMIANEIRAAWNHGLKEGQGDLEGLKERLENERQRAERIAQHFHECQLLLVSVNRDLEAAEALIEELKERAHARTNDQ
jgi:signal recognition particle GTPase